VPEGGLWGQSWNSRKVNGRAKAINPQPVPRSSKSPASQQTQLVTLLQQFPGTQEEEEGMLEELRGLWATIQSSNLPVTLLVQGVPTGGDKLPVAPTGTIAYSEGIGGLLCHG